MSGKLVVFLGLVAGAGWLLSRDTPPIPPGTSAKDSVALATAPFGTRLQFGFAKVGCKLVNKTVRGMVADTRRELDGMRGAIRRSQGGDGTRARKYSQRIQHMDSVALYDLEYAHPVSAVRGAMEAKSLLNAVRQNLRENQ